MNVVKFPYDVSRRVHSKKPRRSKNGTPEERAARAAEATNAVIVHLGKAPEVVEENPASEFLGQLREYFEEQLRRGKNTVQIFDELADTYRRLDEAKRRFPGLCQQSETYDFR